MNYSKSLLLFAVLLGGPAGALGQEQPPDPAKLIADLLKRIEQLELRVAELEGARSTPAVAAPPATTPAATEVARMPSPSTLQAASPEATYPSLHIAGFSDVNFSASDKKGSTSGFEEGQFVLHLSTPLSQRVSFFSELTFSARSDAGTGSPPAGGFNAEVERVSVRFDQSDYFRLSLGRFHTPINWWNTAFHHGQWLQTTASRPEMTRFGGQFIPVHFVGALAEGAVPSGALNLNYVAGFGNGRNSVISRAGDAGDVNDNRAWFTTVFARPDPLFGLQVGGSVYRDKITQINGRNFREWITSGHLVWQKEDPEFIAEFADIRHNEIGFANSYSSQAFYTQMAYRLPGAARAWKPYYRFEYMHAPKEDPVFSAVSPLRGSVLGVRFDISTFVALKFEFRNQRRVPGEPRINSGYFQTSFTF